MADNRTRNIILVLAGILALVMIFTGHLRFGVNLGFQSILGTESMSRTLSATQVDNASTFTTTWTLVGGSGVYGVLIDDTLGGGCTFSDGSTHLVALMLSPETTQTRTITTPAYPTTCSFTGTYSLGNVTTKTFPTQTITVACIPNTAADTNCDKHVKKAELLVYLQSYNSGQVTRFNLLNVLQTWIDGGGL